MRPPFTFSYFFPLFEEPPEIEAPARPVLPGVCNRNPFQALSPSSSYRDEKGDLKPKMAAVLLRTPSSEEEEELTGWTLPLFFL